MTTELCLFSKKKVVFKIDLVLNLLEKDILRKLVDYRCFIGMVGSLIRQVYCHRNLVDYLRADINATAVLSGIYFSKLLRTNFSYFGVRCNKYSKKIIFRQRYTKKFRL